MDLWTNCYNMIWICGCEEQIQWEIIPIPIVLFPFPCIYSHSHAFILIPIPILMVHTFSIIPIPMGSQSFPFLCTSLVLASNSTFKLTTANNNYTRKLLGLNIWPLYYEISIFIQLTFVPDKLRQREH